MTDPRYRRNFSTLSSEDQQRLGSSVVAVIGLGGLGGGVAESLARIGVGTLSLVDGDHFEASNLNRQLFSTEQLLGTSKAVAARDRIRAVNSQVRVRSLSARLNPETESQVLDGVDLVVDCLDSIPDRFMLQEMARGRQIPLVSGAIAGTSGQVTVIFPDDPGFEQIYRLYEDASSVNAAEKMGNLPQCAMCIAAIQAFEAVKVLLNRGKILRNRLLIVDLMTHTFEVIEM